MMNGTFGSEAFNSPRRQTKCLWWPTKVTYDEDENKPAAADLVADALEHEFIVDG